MVIVYNPFPCIEVQTRLEEEMAVVLEVVMWWRLICFVCLSIPVNIIFLRQIRSAQVNKQSQYNGRRLKRTGAVTELMSLLTI